MGKFNRDNSSAPRDFRGRGGFGGGRNSDRPQMHQAICSDCGNDCEVPFKPSGNKPVFCKNCFSNNRSDDSRGDRGNRRESGSRDSRPSFGEKRMYKAICDQCNKECEVPFRPTGEKPIFCDTCFGKADGPRNIGGGNKNFQVQFDEINAKLDKILKKLAYTVTRDGVKKGAEVESDDVDNSEELTETAEVSKEKKVKKKAAKKTAKSAKIKKK